MADGQGCVCMAYSSSECACDADWTPQEVIDLTTENKRLRAALVTFDEAMRNGSMGADGEKEKLKALRAAHKKALKALSTDGSSS